jgi:hypothetical protein
MSYSFYYLLQTYTHCFVFLIFVLAFVIDNIPLETLFPGKNAAVLSSVVLFLLFLTLFHSNI